MTQQEFYARTQTELSDEMFWAIHEDYCNSQLDKDEYCKQWLHTKYAEANKKVSRLLGNLKEINRDIKGYLRGGEFKDGVLKGMQVVRKETMIQLYAASHEANEWCKKVFAME